MLGQPVLTSIHLGRIGHPGPISALHLDGFLRTFNSFDIAL